MSQRFKWTGSISDKWIIGLATVGRLGLKMKAPGTWGSAAGIIFYAVCFYILPWVLSLFLLLPLCYFTAAICDEAELRMGKQDPGEVILDEFVAMPFCFLGLNQIQPAWTYLLVGFVLFRILDIAKPFPISRLQKLPGGWGVLADDIAAALVTCLILHLINQFHFV